jgi:hypothetical protein
MAVSTTYLFTCDRCGAQATASEPGVPGWVQLGISGDPNPSPFLCGWTCLLHVVAERLVAEPVAPHSH